MRTGSNHISMTNVIFFGSVEVMGNIPDMGFRTGCQMPLTNPENYLLNHITK